MIHTDHAGMTAAGTGIVFWKYIPIKMPVRMVWTVELTMRPHFSAVIDLIRFSEEPSA